MSASAKTRAVPQPAPAPSHDPVALAESLRTAAEKSAKVIGDFAARQAKSGHSLAVDELGIGKAFMEVAAKMLANPYRMAESQMNLWWNYMNLWQASTIKLMGGAADPVATPGKGDKRFKHEDWEQHFLFDYIKQSYLIAADALHDAVGNVEGLDEATKRKVNFFTRQYIDALAPSNFALTNPEVFRETIATGGQNLVKGLHNLLDDIERGDGQLKISMTDPEGFRARRQHRDHAGQGRLPERSPSAHPVRADDAQGREAAAARSFRRGSTSTTSSTCARRTRS